MAEPTKPDRACDRCRERRVKCDKRHPQCFRCEKLGKSCPGYVKKRKFVDEGELLRRKFDPPAGNRPHASPVDASRSPVGTPVSLTYDFNGQVDHDTNAAATILSTLPTTTTVFEDTLGPVPDLIDDEALNDVIDETTFDPEWFDLDPTAFYGQAGNSCGFLPNAPNIVDEVDRSKDITSLDVVDPLMTSKNNALLDHAEWDFWASETQLQTSSLLSDEREHEMAYLIRHFSESIGPWMDLFDCEKHFAQLVPLKALRDVLLKNAVAAIAAKHLGCMKGHRPFSGTQTQKPALMETVDFETDFDWFYKAANYYDKAIMYSRVYLQQLSGSISTPLTPTVSASLSVADTDDLLLAVSIFSLYEYLDNAEFGWMQHLTGLKSILGVLTPPVDSFHHSTTALGRRASFWNFARADYQAAYINRTPTLLDTQNLPIWLDAGLEVQLDGNLYADPSSLMNDQRALASSNQLVAHTLLWILLQIMNHLYTTHIIDRQAQWQQLTTMLNAWQAARPRAFQPCARLRHRVKRDSNTSESPSPTLSELFFSTPLCAATVQLYHFARLLLLLNRPTASFNTSACHAVESNQVLAHAYTIIGIAIARPQPAVRVEMILPLYLAGSCLKDDDDRQIVVDLLQAIGKDTGCEAGGRIKELSRSWGWTSKQISEA